MVKIKLSVEDTAAGTATAWIDSETRKIIGSQGEINKPFEHQWKEELSRITGDPVQIMQIKISDKQDVDIIERYYLLKSRHDLRLPGVSLYDQVGGFFNFAGSTIYKKLKALKIIPDRKKRE